MPKLLTTAGAKVFIGPVKTGDGTDFTAADFAGITGAAWIEIKGTTNLGSFGDKSELVSSNQIATRRTRKAKGSRNTGGMTILADIDTSDPGQLAVIAAERTDDTYAFRLLFSDKPSIRSLPAAISIATPGVVTSAGHGLTIGQAITFSTTGALPTGLTAGTTYYVKTAPDANTFTVAATAAGAAIATSGTQSGTHTITTIPTASERLFTALVMSAEEQMNEANTNMQISIALELDSNLARISATG